MKKFKPLAKQTKANPVPESASNSRAVSVSPGGEVFPLPAPDDYAKEFKRLQKLAAKHRKERKLRGQVLKFSVFPIGAPTTIHSESKTNHPPLPDAWDMTSEKFPASGIIVLYGPSGSGKTKMLQAAARYAFNM